MAKDPAFLFYSNDFLSGTFTMTDEQVGKYIRLLCLQHQKSILSEKDMLNICKTYDEDIFCKFIKTEEGFYNDKLKEVSEKRKLYSESRKNNRKSKKDMLNICKTYDKHMENEIENNIFSLNNNTNTDISKDSTKDLRVSNSENWFETKKQLVIDEQLHMKVCGTYGINKENLEVRLIDFIDMLELKEDFKSYKETKNHFINWISKSIKEEKNKPYRESTGTDRANDYQKRKKLHTLRQELNLIDS
jgi:hypothetical protein